jgi:pyrrolidone-carboxylate peptidase
VKEETEEKVAIIVVKEETTEEVEAVITEEGVAITEEGAETKHSAIPVKTGISKTNNNGIKL